MGIGPLRPTPAHSCFSFHDGREIRGCGGIGRPTGSGWKTEERFLGVEAFVMEGNGQVLVLKEGLVLKGYLKRERYRRRGIRPNKRMTIID